MVVIDFADNSSGNHLQQIFHQWKDDAGIELDLVGCFFGKKLPEGFIKEKATIFTKEQLDFWGLPKGEFTEKILSKKYDLLLNFCEESTLCSDFLLGMIDAKVKAAGAGCPMEEHMDLFIESPVKSTKLEISKNIFRYLKMINKK